MDLGSIAEKAPMIAVLIAIVVLFIRYLSKKDELAGQSQERHHTRLEKLSDQTTDALVGNTEALTELKGSVTNMNETLTRFNGK